MENVTRKGALLAVASRYGAVALARSLLADLRSDLVSMDTGAAENNPLLVAKHIESMRQTVADLSVLFDNKDYRDGLENSIIENLKEK